MVNHMAQMQQVLKYVTVGGEEDSNKAQSKAKTDSDEPQNKKAPQNKFLSALAALRYVCLRVCVSMHVRVSK